MNINPAKEKSILVIAFALVFSLSLTLRVWFSFFDAHTSAAFACDAAEYLRNAQSLDLSLHRLFCQQQDIFIPLKGMSISGPVFPAFLLACYKIVGQSPSIDLWMIPVAGQCLLSALASVLIMAIGNACWGIRTAIIAGVLSAFYPGFIVNSGRLYSESFACFLLSLVLWLVSSYLINGRIDYKRGLLLGVILFALQLTRSIMVVLSFGALALIGTSSLLVVGRRTLTIKYLLAMVIGFSLCLLPWLFLQKLALGTTSLVVDRCSKYNLLVGNDVDGLGWLSIPYQDSSVIDHESHWQIIKNAIRRSPQRWFKLMLDKPVRLFKLPWNDFRAGIGNISPAVQAIFHQLILALAAIGLIICNTRCDMDSEKKFERQKIIARFFILFVFLLHFIYIVFITVPRYALTAMPEVILFASAAMAAIINALQLRQLRPLAIKLLAVITVLMVLSQVNVVGLAVPLNSNDIILNRFGLCASVVLKLIAISLFYGICWQLVVQWQRRKSEVVAFSLSGNSACALLIIVLLVICTLPSYCLPLRAHGRLYEWSQPLKQSGAKIERLIRLKKELAERLVDRGAYLAINLAGGANLSADADLLVNDIRIDSPFVPGMAVGQDLNLVKRDTDYQLTVEQEYIFHCLCNASGKDLLDLRQWYMIPINGDQWQKIINAIDQSEQFKAEQVQDDLILHVVLCKHTPGDCTIYGAYPSDRDSCMIPSLSRFSWEKAFYGVESESEFSDPSYDEKIKRSTARLSDALSPALNNVYIKLLVPQNSIIAADRTGNSYSEKDLSVVKLLTVINKQCMEENVVNRGLLLFKPALRYSGIRRQNDLWLIRLTGEVKNDAGNINQLVPWTSMHFIAKSNGNSQKALSYRSPWAPIHFKNNLPLKNDSVNKFDYCFPILTGAFPGQLDRIDLHTTEHENSHGAPAKQNSSGFVKCCLQIYQMPSFLLRGHYEIF